MKISRSLVLLPIFLFYCCDDIEYDADVSVDNTFECNDFDFGLDFNHHLLENLAVNFKLSEEEKVAVRFLRRALTDPMIAKGVPNVRTYSDDEFYGFLFMLNANKIKYAVYDIVMTLRVRNEILDIISNDFQTYGFKDFIFAKEQEYLRNLKIACSYNGEYERIYLSLISADNSSIFETIKNQIALNKYKYKYKYKYKIY